MAEVTGWPRNGNAFEEVLVAAHVPRALLRVCRPVESSSLVERVLVPRWALVAWANVGQRAWGDVVRRREELEAVWRLGGDDALVKVLREELP